MAAGRVCGEGRDEGEGADVAGGGERVDLKGERFLSLRLATWLSVI